jgi:hypothetical protein
LDPAAAAAAALAVKDAAPHAVQLRLHFCRNHNYLAALLGSALAQRLLHSRQVDPAATAAAAAAAAVAAAAVKDAATTGLQPSSARLLSVCRAASDLVCMM